jgi:hypothetical protein
MRPGARAGGLRLAVALEGESDTVRVLLLEEERECVEDDARILGAPAEEGCPRPIPGPTAGFGFGFGFGFELGLG